jgi:hypothetical protein
MMTFISRAPVSSVLAQLGRVFAGGSSDRPIDYDPVFLPDFPMVTPDLALEMGFRKGRDR